jgi:hypothetical protein
MKKESWQEVPKVPDTFLSTLKVKAAICQGEELKTGPSPPTFTIVEARSGQPIGTLYRAAIGAKSQKMAAADLAADIKRRLTARQLMSFKLPLLSNPILPIIQAFTIELQSDQIVTTVLLEYIGSSFPKLVEERSQGEMEKNFVWWMVKTAQQLHNLTLTNLFLHSLGPELFYARGPDVRILDLDDVVYNSHWTMAISELRAKGTWRDKRKLKPICHSLSMEAPAEFLRLQVYMWAFGFMYLALGNVAFEKLVAMVTLEKQSLLFPDGVLESAFAGALHIPNIDKYAMLLRFCLARYPRLCPSWVELKSCLLGFETLSRDEIIRRLGEKCANCGSSLPISSSDATQADCTNATICSSCVQARCTMCSTSHLLNSAPAEPMGDLGEEAKRVQQEIVIVELESKIRYAISEAGATFGRKKNNHIGTFLGSCT